MILNLILYKIFVKITAFIGSLGETLLNHYANKTPTNQEITDTPLSIGTLEALWEEWQHSILHYLPKAIIALLIIIIFYFIGRLAKKISLKFYSKILKKYPGLVRIISTIIFFLFLFFGVFLALEHIQEPFKTGDWVKLEEGFGTIKTVGWITTSIETISGEEFFVPNQLIYNNTFINYSTFGKRRIIFKSGVSYGDDLDLVKKVALEEVNKIDSVLKNEVIDFYFTDIGSSAYNFEVRFWIKFEHQKDIQCNNFRFWSKRRRELIRQSHSFSIRKNKLFVHDK